MVLWALKTIALAVVVVVVAMVTAVVAAEMEAAVIR